ncbi:MAG: hypothetical protein KDC90_12325, partial [Ignavibacteriae bacterium]|nr:hypothetical protein [Ignavibacteriota bacterium]
MKFIHYIKQNKTLSILLSVIFSIFIIGIIGNKIINDRIENWSSTIEEKTKSTEQQSTSYLNNFQQNFISNKKNVEAKLNNSDSLTFESIEKALSKIDLSNNFLALFQKDLLLYWNENYDQQISFDDTLNLNLGETYFLNSGIDIYLLIKDSVKVKNQKVKFIFGKVIEKEYELNPFYFKDVSLSSDLSSNVKTECKIFYSPKSVKNKDGRKYSFPIINNKDNNIGSVIFVKQTREKAVIELENFIFIIQSLLALLGYLLFGLVLYQKIHSHKSLILKFILVSLYLITLRYLLVLIKFPKSIFTSDLLSDKIYYSKFIYGLANSPIELFLTLSIFLIIFYSALRYSIRFFKKETEVKNSKTIFILLFIFFLIIYLLSLRGFGAAIRSFVFDTSIRYFQNPSLNFTSEHLLMHINVLLMGLISILGSASFIIILFKQYQSTFKKNNAIFFIASLIVFLISIFIFSQIQKQPQSTIFIKSIHIILVLALAYIVAFYDFKFITKAILFYLTASFISIITLLFYNSELEKESLKTTANVITRANDNLYKSLITETLLDNFSMRIGVEAFENPNANFNSYAFMIWSKSNLQKESMNSSVNFIDLNGNLLGGFGSIYPKININKIVDTNNVIEEIQIFEENLENDSQKLLRGIFPVKDEFSFLGYLDVSILSDINDFGFNSHPEFISSGKLNEKAILKLDKLAILDYRNKELKIVYGDLNPSKEMNATILNTQLTEKNDAWLDTDFNDSEYIIYIKKVLLNNFERIVAVALRDKDLSIGLFDFFKVFFTHVIVLLILIGFYLMIFYRREKKYQLDLRTQLLWAFLIISLIPLLLIAYFFRDITDSKNAEATYYKLGKRSFSIESYLADHFANGENKLQTYFDASNDLNINFTI